MSNPYFERIRTMFTDKVPHCRAMGMRAVRVEHGIAEVEMPCRPAFVGNIERDWIHGGVLSTLLDTASGMAACTVIDEAERVVTLDLRVDYLRPAAGDRPLSARAECYRLTRTIAFIDAWVWQDGVGVAVGRSTFARLADDARPAQPGAAVE